MKSSDLYEVRDYRESDLNFILATWLRGLKYGNDWYNLITPEVYFNTYKVVIQHILKHPGTSTKIACLKDDSDVILGYAVLNKQHTVLHWSFVKSPWRNIGIMKTLVPRSVEVVTHMTKVGLGLLRKNPGMTFNPFLPLSEGEKQ
jgi:hypothetical protein